MKLRHIHDLSALQGDLQHNDITLSAQLVGYLQNLLNYHVVHGGEPRQKECKLAWRVLLAKAQSNRAFRKAAEDASFVPQVEEIGDALKYIWRGDSSGIASYLDQDAMKTSVSIFKMRKRFENGRFLRIHKRGMPLARAVILRARENRKFIDQLATWGITYKDHGNT